MLYMSGSTGVYDAGLTSIGAVKLTVALSEALGTPVRIADIKAYPTVKGLEAFFASSAPEETYELRAEYPIAETQNGIFIKCMNAPETTVYNIPALLKLGDSPYRGGVREQKQEVIQ